MTAHVALLRAVNVAGNNMVPMVALKAMARSLGLDKPRTLLQSGNLVCGSQGRSPQQLEALLERGLAETLGVTTAIMVRTATEWRAAIDDNPLAAAAATDPSHVVMVSCKAAITPDRVVALMGSIRGRETVQAVGRHLYVSYPDGIGRSKLTAAVIDRHLGTPGTARNWNTVLKLAALLSG